MGASQTVNDLLRTRFEAQWATLRPTVPVEMPNGAAFTKPRDAPWARFSILSDAFPEHLAAGPGSAERHYERVQLEVFAPLGSGNGLARLIADDFASIWRSANDGTPAVAGFLFYPTQVLEVGRPTADAAWWKVDALTPFEREFQP